MSNIANNPIQGVIFDYGGTIDTDAMHWAEVLWGSYQGNQVPVDKESFRQAYVHGERTLAREPLVKPTHDFHQVLRLNTGIQMRYLWERGFLTSEEEAARMAERVADDCHQVVLHTLERTRPVVTHLATMYPLVLVSNFYGNIQHILRQYGLSDSFRQVIESSVVGVRKPDPAIFRLGVEALGLPASSVLVVGDSFTKDILPARSVGCRTVWLKGVGWTQDEGDEHVPDGVIRSLVELPAWMASQQAVAGRQPQ